jgi:guanylate kinase
MSNNGWPVANDSGYQQSTYFTYSFSWLVVCQSGLASLLELDFNAAVSLRSQNGDSLMHPFLLPSSLVRRCQFVALKHQQSYVKIAEQMKNRGKAIQVGATLRLRYCMLSDIC